MFVICKVSLVQRTAIRGVARHTFVRKNVHIVFANKEEKTENKKGGEREKAQFSY